MLILVPTDESSQHKNQIESLSKSTIFYAGELTPGDEGIPSSDGKILTAFANNQYIVMLGDNSAVFMNKFGTFSLCSDNIPFLQLTIGSDGGLLLNTEVLDSAGNQIVTITDNRFAAVPSYAFNPRIPDSHTLLVYDSRKVEVLNIQYLNPKVLRIVGTFRLVGKKPLIISTDGTVQIAGNTIHHLYVNGGNSEKINIE